MEGKIKKLFDSYGFLGVEDRSDVFFHRSEAEDFETLREGDMVHFELGEGKKGDKVAVRVEKVE